MAGEVGSFMRHGYGVWRGEKYQLSSLLCSLFIEKPYAVLISETRLLFLKQVNGGSLSRCYVVLKLWCEHT